MMDGNDFRVVHMDDTVTHIPYDLSYDGYHHINREVWYNDETDPLKYQVCDDSGEDPTCGDSWYGLNIADHK
jgi:hypothetical protein